MWVVMWWCVLAGLVAPDIAGKWLVVEMVGLVTFNRRMVTWQIGYGWCWPDGCCESVDVMSISGGVDWCGWMWRNSGMTWQMRRSLPSFPHVMVLLVSSS